MNHEAIQRVVRETIRAMQTQSASPHFGRLLAFCRRLPNLFDTMAKGDDVVTLESWSELATELRTLLAEF